jgi:isocitrate dehydrogenase
MKPERISWSEEGHPIVPDQPIIAYIEGDGTGPEIFSATRPVLDAAVKKAYAGARKIHWKELLAGEKACKELGPDQYLPQETLEGLRYYGVALKGPLTTPIGGGIRSINVAIRQILDLYACIRPVRYIPGLPSPLRYPERVDLVIFRENTEDVYAGIEWPAGDERAKEIIRFINQYLSGDGVKISEDSAIGIKPMSRFGTQRLVDMALKYALRHGYKSVTLVHKGNIMKFTEGAFREWGYELARERYRDKVIFEQELVGNRNPHGKLILKDRIADNMFQQMILRPEEYGVLATPNLNGDYLSDAAAALVGGLGMAPGANVGDRCAVFEATHGSAPKYKGLDKMNPSSLILSGVEMLRYLGWEEAAGMIILGLHRVIQKKLVTYDLARQMEGATEVSCSKFGGLLVEELERF